MGTNSIFDRLLPYATKICRRKARSLAGQYGISHSDVEDIMQALLLDILCRADRFDSARGSEEQFICALVRNSIATLIERRKAVKRRWDAPFISLDEEVGTEEDDGAARHEFVNKETYLKATRGSDTPESRATDLRLDLERALAHLPAELRRLAEQLADCTQSELARETGIPRTTLNYRTAKLRHHLRNFGLEN